MTVLVGIFTLCLGVAALFLALRRRFPAAMMTGYLCAIGATLLAVHDESQGGYRAPPPEDTHAKSRPQEDKEFDGFVSSDTCRSCHSGAYDSWHASYHRTMTQLATPESVMGNFDGQVFSGDDVKFQLQRRGDEFWVRTLVEGMHPPAVDRRVVMTTGSHHYQVYWLDGHYWENEAENDRSIWMLPIAYVPDGEGWIPRSSAFIRPPEMENYFRSVAGWNGTCIKCHATHGVPRRSAGGEFADSRAVEFGIACESCHGPAHEHVAANRDPLRRYRLYQGGTPPDSTIVNPAKLNKYLGSQVCGRCHSIHYGVKGTTAEEWEEKGFAYRPGDDLHATFSRTRYKDLKESALVDEDGMAELFRNYFWSDGVLRVVGREYNGLIESPCFLRGEMSCMSCHSLHKPHGDPRTVGEWANDQLDTTAHTNAACTQCHEGYRNETALASHTYHTPGSSGSLCYNCHMPHTTFGLLKASRNHFIDSPNVKTTIETGRPNACNQCHLDKTLAWTADTLNDWYGIPRPELSADETEVAASILWTLQGDAGERALMAWSFGWDEAREVSGDDWMPFYLSHLFGDPYAGVGIVAARSLKSYPGYEAVAQFPFIDNAQALSLELWKGRHAGGGVDKGHLLLDGNGTIDKETMDRLLLKRDNDPIHLLE